MTDASHRVLASAGLPDRSQTYDGIDFSRAIISGRRWQTRGQSSASVPQPADDDTSAYPIRPCIIDRFPIVRARDSRPPQTSTYQEIKSWRGLVLERLEDSILVRLFERYRDFPAQEAEVPLEVLNPDDRDRAVPGTQFTWKIGYHTVHGTRRTIMGIDFLRIPPWTQSELDAAAAEAASFRELFKSSSTAV